MKYETNAELPTNEKIAHELYDHYCWAVGGVAFNGDTLPKSDEFFADTTKVKQAEAWRSTANKAAEMLRPEDLVEQRRPDLSNQTGG